MNALHSNPKLAALAADPIAALLWAVAKRADALAAAARGPTDRAAWLRAEWEVFERAERAQAIESLVLPTSRQSAAQKSVS